MIKKMRQVRSCRVSSNVVVLRFQVTRSSRRRSSCTYLTNENDGERGEDRESVREGRRGEEGTFDAIRKRGHDHASNATGGFMPFAAFQEKRIHCSGVDGVVWVFSRVHAVTSARLEFFLNTFATLFAFAFIYSSFFSFLAGKAKK